MNNLVDTLVNHVYDDSIGDKSFWNSKFKRVTNYITYSNADDIVYEYFSNNNVRPKDLDINSMNGWFYLEDNKLKQYVIDNFVHILKKANNYQFCNEIEYYLCG